MNLLPLGFTTVTLALLNCSTVLATVPLQQKVNHPLTIAQSKQLKDTLVIPGQRVGPVTSKTTKEDLIKLFGKSSLTDKTIPGPEGEGLYAATQVNLSEDRSFMVVWSDNTRTKPLDVRNLGTAWKTPEGIGVGTPLSELQQKLGEFKLYGLGWDYSGTIKLESSRLSRYQGKLILQVSTAPDADKKFPNDYKAVSGDGTFSSTDHHWKPLGVRLGSMVVVLNSSK